MPTDKSDLLQGTLDMLILKIVALGPVHGYGISVRIRQISKEVLQVQQGSLYPALHRLERKSWVRSEWKQTESNQRARYYRITAAGKKQLASDLGRWQHMVEVIGAVMHRAPEGEEA